MICNLKSHVHQNDSHFDRCSNPSCKVTVDRIRKISVLRTKEYEVLEKYDKMVKVHDSINKRRQSVCPSVGFPRPKSIGARLEHNNENEIATRQQRRWTMLQSPLPTTREDAETHKKNLVSPNQKKRGEFLLSSTMSSSLMKNVSKSMEKLNIPVDWHYQQEGVTEFTRDEIIFDISSNVSSLNQSLTAPELTTLPSSVRQFEAQKKLEERKKLLQEFDEEMQKMYEGLV